MSALLLADDENRPAGALWRVRDLSERRRGDAELRRLRERLMRSERLSALGEMAARIAHESGAARYDARSDSHYHLRCERTGEVRDLPLPYDPHLIEKIAPQLIEALRREGFEITGHRLELVGQFRPSDA